MIGKETEATGSCCLDLDRFMTQIESSLPESLVILSMLGNLNRNLLNLSYNLNTLLFAGNPKDGSTQRGFLIEENYHFTCATSSSVGKTIIQKCFVPASVHFPFFYKY